MALAGSMPIPWKRLIATLVLAGGIVFFHWVGVIAADDFVVVRPNKGGFTELAMGSLVTDGKTLVIPMSDGSREVVREGDVIGYKVFKYGFPISYTISAPQLPMCTPAWQVPIRIALNVAFFTAICFGILTGFTLIKNRLED